MRAFLVLLLTLCVGPAWADWAYVPPPVNAVVIYDNGYSSRVDAVSGERVTVVSEAKGASERLVYRTWLVRERFWQSSKVDELFLATGAADRIVALWPLQPGESIRHSFHTERNGQVQSSGTQVMTYLGEELLVIPAGTFHAHKLERRHVFTRLSDGKQFHGMQLAWHDSATGLILRLDWETDEPEAAAQGSYVATAVELP
jgi:hypothetical protein